jgi:hypothetical protein
VTEAAPVNVEELEDRLSVPSQQAIEVLGELPGDLILLGVGGKMGPTLARMAQQISQRTGQSKTDHRRFPFFRSGAPSAVVRVGRSRRSPAIC